MQPLQACRSQDPGIAPSYTAGIPKRGCPLFHAGPWLYHAGVDKRIPTGHLRATITLTTYSTLPF